VFAATLKPRWMRGGLCVEHSDADSIPGPHQTTARRARCAGAVC
jgi:hypothetical protein